MGEIGSQDRDYSLKLAERAFELIRAHGSPASPRAYAVWYTYVAGLQPHLNQAVKRLMAEHGSLGEADLALLYDTHIDNQRAMGEARRTSADVIAEVDQLVEMLDLALGSTLRYGESLETISQGLAGPAVNRERVREVVAALVVATRDIGATNRTLEARMRESRTEIAGLRETLQAARVETLTDALTGLANRKHFDEMLVKTLDEAALTRTKACLVVLDIDQFKRFNDEYGHLTGDAVLRLVAAVMREQVKGRATLARFGGEEFGVILPDTGREVGRRIAESIRTSVMGRELVKRSTGESLGKVTVSTGVAALRPGDSVVTLLERADHCMFAAKRAGRNMTIDDTPDDAVANVA